MKRVYLLIYLVVGAIIFPTTGLDDDRGVALCLDLRKALLSYFSSPADPSARLFCLLSVAKAAEGWMYLSH